MPKSKTDKDKEIELDSKTRAVFTKKGYVVDKMLGQGAFGQVYKGRMMKTGMTCAVKVMNMDAMSRKVTERFLPRELSALMEVRHPHVIRVYDIIRANRRIYIFMEYAGNGDLTSYVKKEKLLKETLACAWFRQMCDAVNYLHTSLRLAHRDIKLDNVLLDEMYQCKLTDFGFANLLLDDTIELNEALSETYCGTLPYYCPQLVLKTPYNPFKADSWAMGVVLFAMVCGRFPFHYKSVRDMHSEQTDYPRYVQSRFKSIRSELSNQVRDLTLKLLNPNEGQRIMMDVALKHPWIVGKGKFGPPSDHSVESGIGSESCYDTGSSDASSSN